MINPPGQQILDIFKKEIVKGNFTEYLNENVNLHPDITKANERDYQLFTLRDPILTSGYIIYPHIRRKEGIIAAIVRPHPKLSDLIALKFNGELYEHIQPICTFDTTCVLNAMKQLERVFTSILNNNFEFKSFKLERYLRDKAEIEQQGFERAVKDKEKVTAEKFLELFKGTATEVYFINKQAQTEIVPIKDLWDKSRSLEEQLSIV